jgi:type I site-specific restriction endonuclease
LFKNEFTQAEEEYLKSLGENREIKKPDILLFPEEGKCIIIEFKNPNVNVGEHLNQLNRYASLIRNFSHEEFQIDTFYGYFIGEGIIARDVRAFDGDFKESYHFDYLFRPSKTIPGEDRSDGSLYTEVIKYTTLLARAKRRNKIFIEKLTSQ